YGSLLYFPFVDKEASLMSVESYMDRSKCHYYIIDDILFGLLIVVVWRLEKYLPIPKMLEYRGEDFGFLVLDLISPGTLEAEDSNQQYSKGAARKFFVVKAATVERDSPWGLDWNWFGNIIIGYASNPSLKQPSPM
ncbi:hypothetical protein STEG23_012255, partial [Scotinomys teguina]